MLALRFFTPPLGITKFHLFDKEINSTARLAKAMAHPARIAIIRNILDENICSCSELCKNIPLSLPTISQHLRVLESNGIIVGWVDGRVKMYAINLILLEEFTEFVSVAQERTVLNAHRNQDNKRKRRNQVKA